MLKGSWKTRIRRILRILKEILLPDGAEHAEDGIFRKRLKNRALCSVFLCDKKFLSGDLKKYYENFAGNKY